MLVLLVLLASTQVPAWLGHVGSSLPQPSALPPCTLTDIAGKLSPPRLHQWNTVAGLGEDDPWLQGWI